MDGMSSGTDEVLTFLVLGTFFFSVGFTFFVTTLDFTGCCMCEGTRWKVLPADLSHFKRSFLAANIVSFINNSRMENISDL
jgi:hypothetical protein